MMSGEEKYRDYVSRRTSDIARGIKAIMQGNFDIELLIEKQDNEYEAQIEILVLGFNMMCKELKRLDDIAKNEINRAKKYILEQQETIKELSTPIIEIWDDILVLPIIGVFNSTRTADLTKNLLRTIAEKKSSCVILDITGVNNVDSETAASLVEIAKGAGLLGARCVLTGVGPEIAQSLVRVGVDFSDLITLRSLNEGLKDCLKFLGR